MIQESLTASPTFRALFSVNNLQHLNLHSHSRNYKNSFFDLWSARNTFPKAAPRRISGTSTASLDSCLLCPVWSLNLQYSISLPQILLNQFVFLLFQLRSIYVFLSNINFLNDHLVWEQIPAYVLLRDNWVVDLNLFIYYFLRKLGL